MTSSRRCASLLPRPFAEAVERHEVDLASGADPYRDALVAELQQRPFEFDLQVQLCTNLDLMPVHDVTVEWPESLSPFVTVAKVHLPAQDISGESNLEQMDALSFTPWRVTADHAPLGEIQRVRKRRTDARRSSGIGSTIRTRRGRAACTRCSARTRRPGQQHSLHRSDHEVKAGDLFCGRGGAGLLYGIPASNP